MVVITIIRTPTLQNILAAGLIVQMLSHHGHHKHHHGHHHGHHHHGHHHHESRHHPNFAHFQHQESRIPPNAFAMQPNPWGYHPQMNLDSLPLSSMSKHWGFQCSGSISQ
ncbi:hypothetical protein CEXT_493901 [Caerostris extrusa]|uniref:Uncharacterized protein n=1 Tax=Caerostris extrusa TaxID=172846 RepID=A0AAV4XZ24_CAEEX|nr:hypothetical protein CEXT_493901 [Caerostris extrusa]